MKGDQENMTGMMQGFNWMIQAESFAPITKSEHFVCCFVCGGAGL